MKMCSSPYRLLVSVILLLSCQSVVHVSADVAYIRVSAESVAESRGCRLPRDVGVSVRLNNETLSLQLTRNEDVDSNAPVFLLKKVGAENQKSIVKELLSDNQREAQFQDVSRDAAMTVSCFGDDADRHLQIRGILSVDGKEYKLEPKTRHRRGVPRDEEEYIFEKEPDVHFEYDYVEAPLFEENIQRSIVMSGHDPTLPLKSAIQGRQKRQIDSYYIDVLIVLDYSVYERHYNTTDSSLSTEERRRLALQDIREYFAYIMNGVNLLYKGISGLEAPLVIRLVGYVVAETRDVSHWTENTVLMTSDGGEVNSLTVLQTLKAWVANTSLPANDHVMLFTRYDLFRIVNEARARNRIGIAYTSTTCKPSGRSTSVIEDDGFPRILTAAHELGHSLSSKHDGDGNECSGDDKYIMAASSGIRSDPNMNNPWKFSPCSVQYFKEYLTQLLNTDYGQTCLSQKAAAAEVPLVDDLPGQAYSPDEQCQLIKGPESKLCQGLLFNNGISSICYSMYCQIGNTTYCNKHDASRGTSCGNKKWCIEGLCVYSDDAPSIDETCPFGDESGIVFREKTCDNFIRNDPLYCYQAVVRRRCCRSCSLQHTGVSDCPYGDKYTGCRKQNCGGTLNDGTSYEDACCGTCRLYVNTTTTTGTPTTSTTTATTTTPTTVTTTTTPSTSTISTTTPSTSTTQTSTATPSTSTTPTTTPSTSTTPTTTATPSTSTTPTTTTTPSTTPTTTATPSTSTTPTTTTTPSTSTTPTTTTTPSTTTTTATPSTSTTPTTTTTPSTTPSTTATPSTSTTPTTTTTPSTSTTPTTTTTPSMPTTQTSTTTPSTSTTPTTTATPSTSTTPTSTATPITSTTQTSTATPVIARTPTTTTTPSTTTSSTATTLISTMLLLLLLQLLQLHLLL